MDWFKSWPDWLRWIALLPAVLIWVIILLKALTYFFLIVGIDENGFVARIILEFFTGVLIVYIAQLVAPKEKSKVTLVIFVLILLMSGYALTIKSGVVQAWGATAQMVGAGIAIYYQRRQAKKIMVENKVDPKELSD